MTVLSPGSVTLSEGKTSSEAVDAASDPLEARVGSLPSVITVSFRVSVQATGKRRRIHVRMSAVIFFIVVLLA